MTTKPVKYSSNALFFSAIMATAAALSGCGGGQGVQAKEADKVSNAVPVEVATAALNPISASYNGTASLVAEHEAQVDVFGLREITWWLRRLGAEVWPSLEEVEPSDVAYWEGRGARYLKLLADFRLSAFGIK